MMNAPSQRASAPIPFAAKSRLLALNLVSGTACLAFGSYLFVANTGRWERRFVFALLAGLVVGLCTRVAVRLLTTILFQCRQLVLERRAALSQRVLGSGLVGLILWWFIWDFSDGLMAGLQVAALLAVIGSAIGVLSLAQSDQPQQLKNTSTVALSPPLLTAFLLAGLLLNAPHILVTAENDGSWGAVLNHAHLKHWQFGKQIIFTYGPLGFLSTPWFSTNAECLRLATDVALTFSVAVGLCLLVWRLPVMWRYVILAALVLSSPNIHRNPAPHAGVDLLLSQGLLCWGLLCLLESAPRLLCSAFIFTGLAVFAALSKTAFLALSLLSVGSVAGCLSLRGDHKLGFSMAIAFAVGILCLWIALGQHLSNLGDFLTSALSVAAPYDQTMYFPTPLRARWWGSITVTLSLVSALKGSVSVFQRDGRGACLFRWLATVWLVLLSFITWKNGFARGDSYHVEAFVGFALLLGLLMTALGVEVGTRTTWTWPLAIALCLAAIGTLKQSFFPGYIGSCLEHPLTLLNEKADVLSRPTHYWESMARAAEPVHRGAQLTGLKPAIGHSSIDVFGNQQAVALFNNFNYQPRPIFASYAAYSLSLMSLNEDFYFSRQAPEFVLFRLDALSSRFPPLEDALLLRDLLINYDAVATERGLLLLRQARTNHPGLRMLLEGAAKPNERIALSDYGDADLWMEIEIKPTVAGEARRLLYNASGIRIRVWRSRLDENSTTFEAPAPMLAAGFLASPLLLNTQDVANLYSGTRIVRPIAYSIELAPNDERWWQDAIYYRIFRIEGRLAGSASELSR